jgi:hypothetical protein
VTEFIPKLRQKADEFLTNYLRDTTTDQEILDFYGEGNIIGRKGIPESRRELLDQVFSSKGKNRPKLPHNFDAYDESYGDKVPKHVYETIDMPANSPTTGRPWQMTFGKFPFPHEGQATPAANQFLNDFRVPSRPVDYGFDTGPNILDRNERDITNIKEDLHSYERTYNSSGQKKQGDLRQSKIEEIKELENRAPGYLRPSGRPATPDWWKQEGYEPPANIKDATLNTFKEAILQREGPFGSVSQLTPVSASSRELRPGGDPDWRANMYEKIGFAGPRFPQTLKTDRDVSSADVQSFVPGRERLLPIQPYTEFFEGSAPSVVGKEPAPDFTSFQKGIGTRNYLIGRNILQGRGSLGQGFRSGLSVGVADFIPSPEAIRNFYAGKPVEGIQRMAGDIATGIPIALTAGATVAAAPALAPVAAAVGLASTGSAAGRAADEVVRQQTGEGILSKLQQTIGTRSRTGVATRDNRSSKTPVTPTIRPLTSTQKAEAERLRNRNELERRLDLARERFNPARGEFGFTEIFFGR